MLVISVDGLDLKALAHLSRDGRASWSDLAAVLGLSAPSAAERVKRLEESGVIAGYTAVVNPQAVGCALTAFVNVVLAQESTRTPFLALVDESPAVQECHHVTGDFDYLLKVRCASTSELEKLIAQLKVDGGAVRTQTLIALSTAKESCAVPLAAATVSASEPRQRSRA